MIGIGAIAQVPDEQPDWSPECRTSRKVLQAAVQRAIDCPSIPSMVALQVAQRAFGAALLALDKARRPSFYVQQSRRGGKSASLHILKDGLTSARPLNGNRPHTVIIDEYEGLPAAPVHPIDREKPQGQEFNPDWDEWADRKGAQS